MDMTSAQVGDRYRDGRSLTYTILDAEGDLLKVIAEPKPSWAFAVWVRRELLGSVLKAKLRPDETPEADDFERFKAHH